jgi:hypothetical protein
LVLLAMTFGGGTFAGIPSDAFVQLCSLAMLAFILVAAARNDATLTAGSATWIMGGALLLPLLQLLPMPPQLWTALPGRAEFAATYRDLGMDLPWLPVSISPEATNHSFMALLPPLAVFLATINLGPTARRSLVLLLLAVGVIAVLLGLAQLVGGPDSPLRFFPITNPDSSVGFFANRNHHAAFLYSLVPFTAAWLIALLATNGVRGIATWACLLIWAALLLGAAMTLSRAGVVLGLVASLASLAMARSVSSSAAWRGLALPAAAVVVGLLLVAQFAFAGLLGRAQADIADDLRLPIAQTTLEAGHAFQPVGSGFGTFVPVYQMFETTSTLIPAFINRAHNDWLEVWLEGGWPAIGLLVAFVGWLIYAAIGAWRRSRREAEHPVDRLIPQAASIMVVLLLLHSAVDYPLRTTAMSTLLALCCGLLIKPATEKSGRTRSGSDQRRSSAFRSHRS